MAILVQAHAFLFIPACEFSCRDARGRGERVNAGPVAWAAADRRTFRVQVDSVAATDLDCLGTRPVLKESTGLLIGRADSQLRGACEGVSWPHLPVKSFGNGTRYKLAEGMSRILAILTTRWPHGSPLTVRWRASLRVLDQQGQRWRRRGEGNGTRASSPEIYEAEIKVV